MVYASARTAILVLYAYCVYSVSGQANQVFSLATNTVEAANSSNVLTASSNTYFNVCVNPNFHCADSTRKVFDTYFIQASLAAFCTNPTFYTGGTPAVPSYLVLPSNVVSTKAVRTWVQLLVLLQDWAFSFEFSVNGFNAYSLNCRFDQNNNNCPTIFGAGQGTLICWGTECWFLGGSTSAVDTVIELGKFPYSNNYYLGFWSGFQNGGQVPLCVSHYISRNSYNLFQWSYSEEFSPILPSSYYQWLGHHKNVLHLG